MVFVSFPPHFLYLHAFIFAVLKSLYLLYMYIGVYYIIMFRNTRDHRYNSIKQIV